MTEPLATKTAIFDVAVIGAGVVGCAMARRFALEGARVVLLEKSTDILSGASKGNSAILHTGFDAPPGSIELACMQEGYREYRDIHARLNLPLLETGALVAAWSDEDLARLPAIVEQAHGNGVDDVRQIGRDEVLALEPQLAGNVLGAVRVPGEHLIDPWSAPLAYLQQAQAHGAEACFNVEVLDGAFDGGEWLLHTRRGDLRARQVINCAGLFGDQLELRLLGAASFAIHPRKGQFVVFDKAAAALLRHILLPVPNERTKGVVFTRTVFGNLLAGPTAEEQDDREQARVDSDTLQRLIDAAVERLLACAACRSPPPTQDCGRPAKEGIPHPPGRRTQLDQCRRHPFHRSHRGAGHRTPRLSSLPGWALPRSGSRAALAAGTEPRRTPAARLAASRLRRDRLPLRDGHPPGNPRRPGRPAASRRLRRPEASHPRLHGTLPGFLLQRAGRRAERRPPRPAPRHRELP